MSSTTPVSADRLREIIKDRHPVHFHVFADLFAMGCLLHAQGHRVAGLKLINEVRHTVTERGITTYLSDLVQHLPGNEFLFAKQVHAHYEINVLLDAERARRDSNATDLIKGNFYMVRAATDPDSMNEWERGLMPARFDGFDVDGGQLWNYLQPEPASWPVVVAYPMEVGDASTIACSLSA